MFTRKHLRKCAKDVVGSRPLESPLVQCKKIRFLGGKRFTGRACVMEMKSSALRSVAQEMTRVMADVTRRASETRVADRKSVV